MNNLRTLSLYLADATDDDSSEFGHLCHGNYGIIMGFVAMVQVQLGGVADDTSTRHKHEGVAVYLLPHWRGIRNNLGFILIPQGAELLLWQILKDISDGVEGARTFIPQVLPRRILEDNY